MATNRLTKLQGRRIDPVVKGMAMDRAIALEEYAKLKEDDAVKYAVGAMEPIDKVYTNNCFVEGDRVKSQLDKGLNKHQSRAEFEYQGSVTNNTHIKAHSDIDLLTLHAGFYTLQPPGVPAFPYAGDVISELKQLRSDAANVLNTAFPEVTVDSAPGKSISLEGGH